MELEEDIEDLLPAFQSADYLLLYNREKQICEISKYDPLENISHLGLICSP